MNEVIELLNYKNSPWLGILLALMIGLVISYSLIKAIKVTANRKDWPLIRVIQRNLTNVLYFFIPLAIETAVTKAYALVNTDYQILHALSKVALIAVSTWLAIRIVIIIEKYLIQKLDFENEDNLHARRLFTKIKFIKRMVVIIMIIIGISVLLMSFESVRQYGVGILTSAGIVSVIIGFAAQKSLANLLAGIQIAFTQPIKIDDVVIVEGEWGRIEEINLTYVVVNIWDMRRLVLPITYFVDKPFQNWTRNDSALIGTAFFRLHFKTDVPTLRNQLHIILKETPLWDGKVWALQVTDTKDQYMEVRAIMSSRNSSLTFDLRCHVREKLIEFIVQNMPEAMPKFFLEGTSHPDQP
ncbi:small-conductance mechanosensitive channel [Dyadobacter jejuensis]|uniref:Small-conductance mechanosensitive channel n=1 Tax=Dyadobacter jejuensis TaxID=1082580 RepID=A0A316AR57_9BACT|nr:mechanosensitive ion channel domain-containing protein [Dyadobacter jejuensis]PWJ59280.1 small-conductance mechanosensitive channel [Dyadobacter jejuensis]